MVMAEIDGFFQMYHSLKFDYIINLSTDHYPLKSTKSIYRILQVFLQERLNLELI